MSIVTAVSGCQSASSCRVAHVKCRSCIFLAAGVFLVRNASVSCAQFKWKAQEVGALVFVVTLFLVHNSSGKHKWVSLCLW